MTYYFSKTIRYRFDEAVSKVKKNLKGEGFGVLTEIDAKDSLKKKLDVDLEIIEFRSLQSTLCFESATGSR